MSPPRSVLGTRACLAVLAIGVLVGLGASSAQAVLQEGRAPEGWWLSRVDTTAQKVIPAGPLRPRRDALNLSAMQGVERKAHGTGAVEIDLELPPEGALEVRLLGSTHVSLMLVAGEDVPGARVYERIPSGGGTFNVQAPETIACSPDPLDPLPAGRHVVGISTAEAPWTLTLDGAPWARCPGAPRYNSGLKLTPGQDRVHVLGVALTGRDRIEEQRFGRRRFDWRPLVAVPLLLVLAAELLVRIGLRRAAVLAGLAPLVLTWPLSRLDLRLLSARFRLLPDAAAWLPIWAPVLVGLALLVQVPVGAAPGRGRFGTAIAVATAAAGAVALARGHVWAGTAGAIALVAAAGVAGFGGIPWREALGRAGAVAAPGVAAAAISGSPWAGHLAGLGGVLGTLAMVPLAGRAERRRAALPWALGGLLVLSLEVAVRAGPQSGAWTGDAIPEDQGTSGQTWRTERVDAQASVARECVAGTSASPMGSLVAIFGGSTTGPVQLQQLPDFYPAVFETMWNASHPSSRIRVLNQGVPGWTTNEIADCAPQLIEALSPAVVMLYVGRNDTLGFAGVTGKSDSDTANEDDPVSRWLKRSAILGAARFTLLGLVADGTQSPAPIPVARRNVLRVANAAREGGARTLLVGEAMFPRAVTLRAYHAMLRDLAEDREDVDHLDVAERFEAAMDPSLFEDDVHFTTRGHQAMAGLLVREFEGR